MSAARGGSDPLTNGRAGRQQDERPAGGPWSPAHYAGGNYPGAPNRGPNPEEPRRRPPRDRRSGTEPRTARSALRMRLVLAVFGLLTGLAVLIGCAVLATGARHSGGLVLLAALGGVWAMTAAIDILVVLHRRHTGG